MVSHLVMAVSIRLTAARQSAATWVTGWLPWGEAGLFGEGRARR